MKKFARILCVMLVAVMLVCTLASCIAPKGDPDKAEKALEKEGYTVTVIDSAAVLPDGVEAYLSAFKGDEGVMIYYFESAKDAKEYWKDHEDDIKEMKEEAKEEGEKLVVKKVGKMIWVGTPKAVKAAK